MHTQFSHVALDRIRYSLVWEDSDTLYNGLHIQPADRLLVITSAGCNVLNALLKNPRQVTAIDLNPVQNELLRLKIHLISHHSYAVLRALMGFDGVIGVQQAWSQAARTLPADTKSYWAAFFEMHPAGILTAGRLERYITGFIQTLEPYLEQKLRLLFGFNELADQYAFFLRELHDSPFREAFIRYFDNENLSKGRDPKLFTYVQESGGEIFYNRLLGQLSRTLVKHNFFLRFFFFGPTEIPVEVLPPCYQLQHYRSLQKQLAKLTIVDGEAVDYLLSPSGTAINKASLSNIFEYTSSAAFARVSQQLLTQPNRKLRLVYWNLLQQQQIDCSSTFPVSDLPAPSQACFYFRGAHVAESVPAVLSPQLNPYNNATG